MEDIEDKTSQAIKDCQANVAKFDRMLNIAAFVPGLSAAVGTYKIAKSAYEATQGKDVCGAELNKNSSIEAKYNAFDGVTHVASNILMKGFISDIKNLFKPTHLLLTFICKII